MTAPIKPVTPKPASTVILINEEMTEVYLTQRPKTMKFMGGIYVFPGGSVDKADHIQEHEDVIIREPSDRSLDPSHYVAAARELFEEVGIFLGSTEEGEYVRLEAQKTAAYRRQLIDGEISFLQLLRQEGLKLRFGSLQYFGNIITPEGSPYRFDTRFFLAKLPKGQSPEPDRQEVDNVMWITPEEAIAGFERKTLPMVLPTIYCLKALVRSKQGEPLLLPDPKSIEEELAEFRRQRMQGQ